MVHVWHSSERMVWNRFLYYWAHLCVVSTKLAIRLGLVEGPPLRSPCLLLNSSGLELLVRNKADLRRNAGVVGWEVHCLRRVLLCIPAADVVAPFRVSIDDQDDAVCMSIGIHSFNSGLLEVRC